VGQLEELQRENARLHDEAGRRNDEVITKIFEKIDAVGEQVAELRTSMTEMKGESRRHNALAEQSFEQLTASVSGLHQVVCGAPGQETKGLSVRVATVETHITTEKEAAEKSKEAKSKTFFIALAALLTGIFAVGKDYFKRGP
jgi:uncharacterized protein YaaN involved in tellurite resistance